MVVEAEDADSIGSRFLHQLAAAQIQASLVCLWMTSQPSPLRNNKFLIDISQEFIEGIAEPDLIIVLKAVSLRPDIAVAMLHRIWTDTNVPVMVVAPLATTNELDAMRNDLAAEFERTVATGFFVEMTRIPRIVNRTMLGSRQALSFSREGTLNWFIPAIVEERLQPLIELNPNPGFKLR